MLQPNQGSKYTSNSIIISKYDVNNNNNNNNTI